MPDVLTSSIAVTNVAGDYVYGTQMAVCSNNCIISENIISFHSLFSNLFYEKMMEYFNIFPTRLILLKSLTFELFARRHSKSSNSPTRLVV